MKLSLSVETKTILRLWNTKPYHCAKKCSCSEPFSDMSSFPEFALNMEKYRVNRHIHFKCGYIQARPTLNATNFQAVDVRTLLRYFGTTLLLFYSYQLAEWCWRQETSSSNSRCFVSLIPQYMKNLYICIIILENCIWSLKKH